MKKIFTTALIVCSALISRSQDISRGTTMLGGSLGFEHQKRETGTAPSATTTYLNFSPSLGKFYARNRMAGINIFVSRQKMSNGNLNSSYGGGVFLRQYLPVGRSFYFFAEEGASVLSGRYKFTSDVITVTDQKTITAGIDIYPGVAYSITKHFQVELALNNLVNLSYQRLRETDIQSGSAPSEITSNEVNLSAGSNTLLEYLSVGVKWLL